jgi:hypothetical protein
MMKKLLVLMLVLGIASLAPAALQISVDGNPDPVDSEIILAPSEELILDIHGDVPAGIPANWLMVVNPQFGTLNGGDAVQGSLSSIFPYYYTDYFLGYAGLTGSAVSGVAADLGDLSGLLVDGILFHCEGIGDAIVELYSSVDTIQWTFEDAVVIHQIPEPATMALLGLGGLFLARRNK